MKTVAVFEAKNRFSELLAMVDHGEEITITRHGSPIATQDAQLKEAAIAVGIAIL